MEESEGDDERRGAKDLEGELTLTPALTAAVGRGDEVVIAKLFKELRRALVPLARAFEPNGYETEELLTTFLDDFLMDLPTLAIEPARLRHYATVSFRNHLLMLRRADLARESAYQRAARHFGCSESVVAECQSEYSIAACTDVMEDAPRSKPALAAFVRHLRSRLSRDEAILLRHVINGMPLRTIAEWLGIEYPACRVRLHRLRGRLQREAADYYRTIPEAERAPFAALLRRLGIGNHAPGGE